MNMNFKSNQKNQKLTIDTQKLKRKRPKDNIKIIKSQWKRLKREELQSSRKQVIKLK